MAVEKNTLYIVSTPIGHLGDITARALEILQEVDLIAAEDTRHSHTLLEHFGIHTPLISLHEHNERDKASQVLDSILDGKKIALISDAGTPLICDPGFFIVRLAHEKGIKVVPIPGACALIAALSVSGLPTDCFIFEGFLPAKSSARRTKLEALSQESRTLVFYESPHRIIDTLQDMEALFGKQREAAMARELTKTFETIHRGSIEELLQWVQADANQQKGEIVLLVKGMEPQKQVSELTPEVERLLKILVSELPVKQAAHLAHKITGMSKNILYDYAVREKNTK